MLYTPEQKRRRDESVWTLVQGVLAPIQFLIFLVSLGLVIRCLVTGEGEFAALMSVVVKTFDPVHHHAHRLHLGKGCIWTVPVCTRFLLGRRLQHAGTWVAHCLLSARQKTPIFSKNSLPNF